METLILGGGTFVGRRMVEHLREAGHQVTVLNRGKTSTDLPPGVSRIIGDRTSTESMRQALEMYNACTPWRVSVATKTRITRSLAG